MPRDTPPPADARSARGRRGFALVDVVATAAVLFIGLLAMTSTSWVVHALRDSSRTQEIARLALQGMLDHLHEESARARLADEGWSRALARVYGAGAPGETFEVQGLEPCASATAVGRITLVMDETLTDADLGVQLGMPRDLDGDLAVDRTDVVGDALLLPVIIDLRWSSEAGDRELQRSTYLRAF